MADPVIKDPADPIVPDPADPKPPTVTREAFDRLLDEKKKAAKELSDARARLKEVDDAKAAKEAEDAKARGDFETASKADKDRIAALEKSEATLKAERLETRKYGAFIRGLGSALDQKFMPLLDLDKITADENGNLDEASVTKYVADFKKEYSGILTQKGTTNLPGATPKGETSPLPSYEEWLAMPDKTSAERKAKIDLQPKVMAAEMAKK